MQFAKEHVLGMYLESRVDKYRGGKTTPVPVINTVPKTDTEPKQPQATGTGTSKTLKTLRRNRDHGKQHIRTH